MTNSIQLHLEQIMNIRCVYEDNKPLKNRFFTNSFGDTITLEEPVSIPMRSYYFTNFASKQVYAILKEIEHSEPIVDIFLLHAGSTMDLYDDSMNEFNYTYIQGGDIRIPLEDPLAPEEVTKSLFDGTYKPLIDERPMLNGSWLRIKPFYPMESKDQSYNTALHRSIYETNQFFWHNKNIKPIPVKFDFATYDPKMFSQFLVGSEFSFEEGIECSSVMIDRAKEIYQNMQK